jgi:hypothetical protein
MKRIQINESEKQRILSKHLKNFQIDESIVISDWLSPDEKYMILFDELYDIQNQTKIGDVWKHPENLVTFLEHSYRVSNLKREIREHASNTFSKMLLTEGHNDMTPIKPLIKQYLKEEGKGLWDSFTTWLSDTASSTVTGVKDFFVDSWEGIKAYGVAISKGDWDEVVSLLKRGTVWLARKLRQALYSPVGIVVDAILVATGVGKGAQVVAWAIVVALDIYEFMTGDYENPNDPMWMRILFFAIDVIGLVSAGAAAKAAKTALAGVKTEAEVAKTIGKSSWLKGLFEGIGKKLPGISSMLGRIGESLAKTFPKGSTFIKGAVSGIPKFTKGLMAGLKTFGIVGALGTGIEYYKSNYGGNSQEGEVSDTEGRGKEEFVNKLASGTANYSNYI